MKFGTSVIITLLSVLALAAELAMYMFFGFGAALSGSASALSGTAAFFVGLMIVTAVAGIGAPLSALVELISKKQNSGIYTFLTLMGLGTIAAIGSTVTWRNSMTTVASTSSGNNSPTTTNAIGAKGGAGESDGDPEKSAYRNKVLLRNITVGKTILEQDGVFGEIKNTGNRTLKEVEITVYALGKDGDPVWDDKFYPVLDSSFSDSADPLKPNYSRKFGYKLDAPSDWNNSVKVVVSKIEFVDDGSSGRDTNPPTVAGGATKPNNAEVIAQSDEPTTSSGSSAGSTDSTSGTAAASGSAPGASDVQEIRKLYDGWINAWQNRDLDEYMNYYSRSVIQKRVGKPSYGYSQQRNRMSDNWARQSYITISSDDPEIEANGNRFILTAEQTYDSSTWWDKGLKRLVWAKIDGQWKIVEESFRQRDGGKK